MKKLLFALSFIGLLATSSAYGQGFYSQSYKDRNSGSFDKQTSILSIQYGVGHIYGWVNSTSLGPVYVKYEKGIMDEVGIAGYIAPGYSSIRNSDHSYITLGIGALGYYHFNKLIPLEDLDVSAGTGIALRYEYDSYYETSKTRLYLPFKAAAKYYFSKSFGVNLEVGYDGLSYTQAGIQFRF